MLHNLSKKRKFSGQIVLMYGIWYGFGRGFIELLRTDSLMLGAFRVSSLLSFILCAVCLILLIVFLKRNKEIVHEGNYEGQFEDETAVIACVDDVEETENFTEETATNEEVEENE